MTITRYMYLVKNSLEPQGDRTVRRYSVTRLTIQLCVRLFLDDRITTDLDRKWLGQQLSINRQDNDMVATSQR